MPPDLTGLLWAANKMMHVKHWAQSRTHSKGTINISSYHHHHHHHHHRHFPYSCAQGHLASASGCEGTESGFPSEAKSQVHRMTSPISLSLYRPRDSGAPEEKKGWIKTPTRPRQVEVRTAVQTWNWHFKSLVFFLKRGKQDRCIRTHTREGTGDCWEQNKNLISLSLTCSGSGRDEESHCILYLLLSLTDAPLCAQEVHNISRECLHGYGPIIAWGTRRCKWNPRHLLCFWKGFTRMQFISTYQLICRLHCISKGSLIPKSLTKNQDKRPKACDAPALSS